MATDEFEIPVFFLSCHNATEYLDLVKSRSIDVAVESHAS